MSNVTTSIPYAALGFVVVAVVAIKWLRVAQREHYLPNYVLRFAQRWYLSRESNTNLTIAIVMVIAVVAAISRTKVAAIVIPALAVTALLALVSPVGLCYRGRTSKLHWTRRVKVLYGATLAIAAVAGALSILLGLAASLAAVYILATPLIVDLAVRITEPLEARRLDTFVALAEKKLDAINPRRVAITGSYGKTSTKNYLAQICAHSFSTLASPASFNNRAGLARTINENMVPGTEVFIAEMGTYSKGEIASLVSWIHPEISAITAIGPVHLERFGSEEAILAAKSEITKGASCVVLNADDYRLAVLAGELERDGLKVWRVSGSDFSQQVCVLHDDHGAAVVYYQQRRLGMTETHVAPSNLAVAVAIALELGVPEEVIGSSIRDLASPPNRMGVARSDAGVIVIDDTYNSNPAGARLALEELVALASPGGRKVVVTPGMVELGDRQYDENRDLGAAIAKVATDACVVGATNRKALERGLLSNSTHSTFGARFLAFRTRDDAVKWVKAQLVAGDVVLYENDLPDHYA